MSDNRGVAGGEPKEGKTEVKSDTVKITVHSLEGVFREDHPE